MKAVSHWKNKRLCYQASRESEMTTEAIERDMSCQRNFKVKKASKGKGSSLCEMTVSHLIKQQGTLLDSKEGSFSNFIHF